MASKTTVNGIVCDWASMTISMDSDVDATAGLTSIEYADKMDGASLVYGPGSSIPRGSTKGRSAPTCSCEYLRYEWEQFSEAHLKDIPGGFTTKVMTLTVSYTVNEGDIRTDKIEGARITSVTAGGADGTDPAKVQIEFIVTKPIKWHGGVVMTANA